MMTGVEAILGRVNSLFRQNDLTACLQIQFIFINIVKQWHQFRINRQRRI